MHEKIYNKKQGFKKIGCTFSWNYSFSLDAHLLT